MKLGIKLIAKIGLFAVLILTGLTNLTAQQGSFVESAMSLKLDKYELFGTLALPANETAKIPLVLFIAGSGPTDRNGNNSMGLSSNCYQMLCRELADSGIASLRFDKLGAAESKPSNFSEISKERLFDHEVQDVVGWIDLLTTDKRFGKITLVGHSQGGLIAILAAQQRKKAVGGLITVAGLGRRGSETLRQQMEAQPVFVKNIAVPIIDSLEKGMIVKGVPPFLEPLFRSSMQPYLINWFKYDPAIELKKLNKPCLVIQGTNDIQISVADAEYLSSKSKKAQLQLILDMNHVLKTVPGDRTANLASYSNPELPLSAGLTDLLVKFIRNQK